jgi:serine/threonine-protein kinase RsbW
VASVRPLPEPFVRVSVPGRSQYLHVLRSATVSVAATMRIPLDSIEDLRLAVDEACVCLLGLRPAGSRLTIELFREPAELRLVVHCDAAGAWPKPDLEASLPWTIMVGLTDGVAAIHTSSEPAIELRKRTLVS